jgi:hypothetical protein
MGFQNKRRYRGGNFDQNDGVPGVVYILANEAFKEHFYKIGCSRHSGHVRAQDMNREASTGLPAHHVCVFECRTLDCGRAEKLAHAALAQYRKGRQEFFEVPIETAKAAILQAVEEIDRRTTEQLRQAELDRERVEHEARAARFAEVRSKTADLQPPRPMRPSANAQAPNVDLPCARCKIELTIPASHAVQGQRLRCKQCGLVFRFGSEEGTAKPQTPSIPSHKPPPSFWNRSWVICVVCVAVYASASLFSRSERAQSQRVAAAQPMPAATQTQGVPQASMPPPATAPGQPFNVPSASIAQTPEHAPPSARHVAAVIPVLKQRQVNDDLPLMSSAERADLLRASQRAAEDFPYLNTPAGQATIQKINARRDELIRQGVYPSIALQRAVNAFAAAGAPIDPPRPAPASLDASRSVQVVEEPVTQPPKCRWLNSSHYTCN